MMQRMNRIASTVQSTRGLFLQDAPREARLPAASRDRSSGTDFAGMHK